MSVGHVAHGLSKDYHARKYRTAQPVNRPHNKTFWLNLLEPRVASKGRSEAVKRTTSMQSINCQEAPNCSSRTPSHDPKSLQLSYSPSAWGLSFSDPIRRRKLTDGRINCRETHFVLTKQTVGPI